MDHTPAKPNHMKIKMTWRKQKSAITLIHLQDEMMQIQAKMQWRSPAQLT
jgi:hypothetical protein